MATRHIKRLQQQLNASKPEAPAAPAASDSGEDEEEVSEELAGSSKPFNPFDLLTDGDDDAEVG